MATVSLFASNIELGIAAPAPDGVWLALACAALWRDSVRSGGVVTFIGIKNKNDSHYIIEVEPRQEDLRHM